MKIGDCPPFSQDGNIQLQTVDGQGIGYEYDKTPGGSVFDSDLMTKAGADGLTWDNNGQLQIGPAAANFAWNWDGKLRSGSKGTNSLAVKYDPMGNRVWKYSYDGTSGTTRKYIVDINSQLPVILCEIEADPQSQDYGSLKKSYFYADSQILAQRKHTDAADPTEYTQSFYVHDRLGSVRLVIAPAYDGQTWSVGAANTYIYTPFGSFYDSQCIESVDVDNPFKFTGQWHDAEIDQYYLRARMYDPAMMRFTSRDPVFGKFTEPATLHKYLYCWNNPSNLVDLTGESPGSLGDILATMSVRAFVGANTGFIAGVYKEIITELAAGQGLDAAKIMGKGVTGAVMGALAGLYGGYTNPGYEAFIANGGAKILCDMAFSIVAGAIADVGGRSVEGALKRNAAHVLATNAMIESVYHGY